MGDLVVPGEDFTGEGVSQRGSFGRAGVDEDEEKCLVEVPVMVPVRLRKGRGRNSRELSRLGRWVGRKKGSDRVAPGKGALGGGGGIVEGIEMMAKWMVVDIFRWQWAWGIASLGAEVEAGR